MYEDLLVKKSTIPGAGKGLFITRDVKKGERIVEYLGEVITWKECDIRADRDEGGYVFYISRKKCIDAFHTPEHLARFANDAKGMVKIEGLKNNCVYEIYKNRGWIASTKDIKAGSEILVSYGPQYWKDIRHNLKLERDKVKAEEKKKLRAAKKKNAAKK
ncbi:MAG: SET domain-containing protein-lysine N-methyltransferase [Bacteroidota bacterium]